MYHVETTDSIDELHSAEVTFFGDKGYGFFKAVVDGAERSVFFHLYHCDSFRQGLFFPQIEDIHLPSGRWSPDEPKKGDTILFLGTINNELRPGKGEVFNVKRWWKSPDYKEIADSGGTLQDGYEYAVMKYVTVLGPKKTKQEDACIFQGSLHQLCIDFPQGYYFQADRLAKTSVEPNPHMRVETEYAFFRQGNRDDEWEEISDPRIWLGDNEKIKIVAYRKLMDLEETMVAPGPSISLEDLRCIRAVIESARR